MEWRPGVELPCDFKPASPFLSLGFPSCLTRTTGTLLGVNEAGGGLRLTPPPAFHRNHRDTSRDSKALLGQGPQSPFPRHPFASSHPSKAKPDRGPSLASGRPPPELFSHTRGEPPHCHSHSSAYNTGIPGPWLTRPQCPLCAQSCQIRGLLRPILMMAKPRAAPGWTGRARPCGT